MNTAYFQRLRQVEDELAATRKSLAYLLSRWDTDTLDVQLGTPRRLVNDALQNAERTYFIRLFAEWEGILKTHLATRHPTVSVPNKPKVDQLISLTLKAENISLDPVLRRKLNLVRDYRNSIAHTASATVLTVSFSDARSWFNSFIALLKSER